MKLVCKGYGSAHSADRSERVWFSCQKCRWAMRPREVLTEQQVRDKFAQLQASLRAQIQRLQAEDQPKGDNMKIQYFKTYEQAQQVAQTYAGQAFPNPYQFDGEDTNAKIVEYTKGFAIQFGDCGPYLEVTS